MSGGPPKALPSTGPQSLRDMPHPLAGSSSEEAVGGDSTPSPDLLTARSFGDKVGRAGLRVGRLVGLPRGMKDLEPRWAPGRAHPGARFPGAGVPSPRSLGKKRLLSPAPVGSQPRRGSGQSRGAGPAWLVSSANDSWWGGVPPAR